MGSKSLNKDSTKTVEETQNLNINLNSNTICNIVEKWYLPDEDVQGNIDNQKNLEETINKVPKETLTKSEILRDSRKFNFDLSPKVYKYLLS